MSVTSNGFRGHSSSACADPALVRRERRRVSAAGVERRPGEGVLDHLGRRTGVTQAQRALDGAAHALSGGTAAAADDAYAAALDRWLSLGAADLAERTGAVLDDLGLAVDRRRR